MARQELFELFVKKFNYTGSFVAFKGFINHQLGLKTFENNFTKEQKEWLINNVKNYSTNIDLTNAFNKKFNQNRKANCISERLNFWGISRNEINKKGMVFTKEQEEWICNYVLNHTIEKTKTEFDKVFDRTICQNSILNIMNKYNISKNKYIDYSNFENLMLEKANEPNILLQDICDEIKKQYGVEIKKGTISQALRRKGISVKSNWDKSMTKKITEKSRLFKLKYNIGDEVIRKDKNGRTRIYVKVKDDEGSYDNWKQKSYIVWESVNGKVPKDHVLIFLDGNGLNNDITNLKCVSNAVFREIVGNGKNRPKCYGYGKTTEAYAEVLETIELIKKMCGTPKQSFKWKKVN